MGSWLSVHAPRLFNELAVPQSVRDSLLKMSISASMPHLLLSGPAGVGKTAAWRLVARQVLGAGWEGTTHVIQARDLARKAGAMGLFEDFLRPGGRDSDDTLAGRTSLEAFDRGMWGDDSEHAPAGQETIIEPDSGIPISRMIVIEDADHLGMKRQPFLRRMMESEGRTTRFIFTARAPSRIIDALRSRMRQLRIPATSESRIGTMLSMISAAEGVSLSEGLRGDIVHVARGNLRKALFLLELLARKGGLEDRSALHNLVSSTYLSVGRQLLDLALRGKVVDWRWERENGRNRRVLGGALKELDRMMEELGLDSDDITEQLHSALVGGRLLLPDGLRTELLVGLAQCDARLQLSMYPRIQFERYLHEVAAAGARHGLSLGLI